MNILSDQALAAKSVSAAGLRAIKGSIPVTNPYHSKQVSTLSQWFLNLMSNQALAAEIGAFCLMGMASDLSFTKMVSSSCNL